MSGKPPTGVVTFLFTDIEGSTARWERDPEAMADALRRHDEISRLSVEAAGGFLFKSTGDGCCAAFSDPSAAVEAALDLRERLDAEEWPETIAPLRVRSALHTGSPELRGRDYFGPTLNRVARLMGAAHGGQILVSETTRSLLRDRVVPLRDLGKHRLRDLLRPEHIFEVREPEAPHPPLRTLDARSNNLPTQATPFVGRERELAELLDLAGDHSLITLTGPGGAGKTRLAVQAAADLADAYDGVHFVALARVRETEEVLSAVVDAIGLQSRGSEDQFRALSDYLHGRRVLLVLDNFEHVMDAAALVGSLLDAAPAVGFLVTSRELLRLRAEQHYPVGPLALPRPGRALSVEEVASFASVRLFTDRANAVQPGFRLDEGNAGDVAAICRRLDGLPLAIELAAARVRLLSPKHLRAALERDLGLLRGGPVDAPERHQTLLDTIRWSYDLLDDTEQALFRRMAVFSGGRSLEGLEKVCLPGLDMDPVSAADALMDKSLLRASQGTGGDLRLEMLETIHGFARARLEESGELEEMSRSHAAYFADLAERAEQELRGRNQQEWVGRLEDERPNFDAALAWSLGGGDPTPGHRIVAGLRDFWFYQGHYRDMGRWVDNAVASLSGQPARVQAGVFLSAGFHAFGTYRDEAVELLRKAIARYEQAGDDPHRALAMIWLAGAHEILQRDVRSARELLEEGLALARRAGAVNIVAQALNMWGEMERGAGNYERAKEIQQEALEVVRETGERRRIAMLSHNLGLIAHHLGDDEEAERMIRQSLDLAVEQDFDALTAQVLVALAGQMTLRGAPEVAARLVGAADAFFDSIGFKTQPADTPDSERIRRELKETLGDERYERQVAEGALLDLDQAVELARA